MLFCSQVIAQPSIARYEAAPGDFVVVACDGIFEKGFCNEEVRSLSEGNQQRDVHKAGDG